MTGSDKSLTKGGDQIRSKVDLRYSLWGIAPSLSPPHMWDLLGAMWTIKTINNDNLKLVQLVTTLRDRALTWYIKYTTLPKMLTQVRKPQKSIIDYLINKLINNGANPKS